jgi:hypothetical protein
MFPANVYTERRSRLRKELSTGLVLFPGNQEVAFNYPAILTPFARTVPFPISLDLTTLTLQE